MTIDLGKVGIWSRELRYHPDRGARAAAAAELEDLRYSAIFIPEERMLAALGPRMLALARARAGAAHPYLVPPEHTALARQALGPGRVLAAEQAVVLDTDPQRGRERARAFVGDYLALPNYVRNLRRLGFGDDDFRGGGSGRLVDALVARGDEDAIAARVRAHHDAGADHVCIYVFGGGEETLQLAAWRRLAPVLTSH